MSTASNKSNKLRSVNLRYSAIREAGILVVLYVFLLFLLPTGMDGFRAYHMTMLEYKTIRFVITVPVLLVWLAAFMGYATLRQYSLSLKSAPEAEHYDRLATGCAWLAWSLPITAIVSLVLSSMAYEWTGFNSASVILTNYVTLLLPLVAFSIIGIASRSLVSNARLKLSLATARIIVVLFLTAGVLYCYLAFTHFDLTNLSSTDNPYHLPIWAMVLTVIIPYLYAWFVGLLAAYEITLMSKQVQGVLYRHALQWLVAGLVTIIVSSIAAQYINGAEPHVGHIVLDYRLVLSVTFRIIGGAGFILLAIGALKLKKIEEV